MSMNAHLQGVCAPVCIPLWTSVIWGQCWWGYLLEQAWLSTFSPRMDSFFQIHLFSLTPSICLQHSVEEEAKVCWCTGKDDKHMMWTGEGINEGLPDHISVYTTAAFQPVGLHICSQLTYLSKKKTSLNCWSPSGGRLQWCCCVRDLLSCSWMWLVVCFFSYSMWLLVTSAWAQIQKHPHPRLLFTLLFYFHNGRRRWHIHLCYIMWMLPTNHHHRTMGPCWPPLPFRHGVECDKDSKIHRFWSKRVFMGCFWTRGRASDM